MSVDLSLLAPPPVVETIDFETLLDQRKARFIALAPAMAEVIDLESEPAVKLLEEASYDEILLRQRINEAAVATMLAYATGADLDHLAALYAVTRLVVSPGNTAAIPPVGPTLESDDALRARVQMAPEGFSTAGPVGAYRFHVLSADGQVLDASVDSPRFTSLDLSPAQIAVLPAGTIALTCLYTAGLPTPRPGMVRISVLARTGDGTPGPGLLAAVVTALNAEDVRPLTDEVIVNPAEIVPYALRATLTFYPGPSAQSVLDAAIAEAQRYIVTTHRLGYDVTLSGIYAALHRPGVQRVTLIEPLADIICNSQQATYCTHLDITAGGTDV